MGSKPATLKLHPRRKWITLVQNLKIGRKYQNWTLVLETAGRAGLTHGNGACCIAGNHGRGGGRRRFRGKHVVGCETSDQHSENESADGDFHGNVSFSY